MNEIFSNLPNGTVGAAVIWLALRLNAIEARLDAAGLPRPKKKSYRGPIMLGVLFLGAMWLSGCKLVPA